MKYNAKGKMKAKKLMLILLFLCPFYPHSLSADPEKQIVIPAGFYSGPWNKIKSMNGAKKFLLNKGRKIKTLQNKGKVIQLSSDHIHYLVRIKNKDYLLEINNFSKTSHGIRICRLPLYTNSCWKSRYDILFYNQSGSDNSQIFSYLTTDKSYSFRILINVESRDVLKKIPIGALRYVWSCSVPYSISPEFIRVEWVSPAGMVFLRNSRGALEKLPLRKSWAKNPGLMKKIFKNKTFMPNIYRYTK